MSKIKSLAVYCGHKFGTNPQFAKDAARIGELLAENGIRLVYGGGAVGLMGTVAQSALDGGGRLVGISTHDVIALQEPLVKGIESEIVTGINERKQRMYDLSDAFCILPGGMGTMNELTDIVTMQQVGESKKPIYFLNTDGYWNIFGRVMAHMHRAGFISTIAEYNMQMFDYPEDLIAAYLKEHEQV
ncbi:MAG: TIGR00730 family Rossman fold protein [Alphaproteobacteria bacterium]|nr:TIGR00730 family Rossman fold protein [Alphaproteobacteria bacterium]